MSKLKKTEYFSHFGSIGNQQVFDATIKQVIQKRDIWLKENEGLIAKIDNEDLKIIHFSNNNGILTIQISYYLKNEEN